MGSACAMDSQVPNLLGWTGEDGAVWGAVSVRKFDEREFLEP